MKESLSAITGLPESTIQVWGHIQPLYHLDHLHSLSSYKFEFQTFILIRQVWFQNRRARYFKSKKPSREVDQSAVGHLWVPSLCPPFPVYSAFAPSLPSPGFPAPDLPQSTRLSSIPGGHASTPHAEGPVTPLPGLAQCYQVWDPTEYGLEVMPPHGGLCDLDLTEDFERFLFEPLGSRCAEVGNGGSKLSVQKSPDQDLFVPDEPTEDVSDLDLQELGDFSLTDLNISASMMDYLLG